MYSCTAALLTALLILSVYYCQVRALIYSRHILLLFLLDHWFLKADELQVKRMFRVYYLVITHIKEETKILLKVLLLH